MAANRTESVERALSILSAFSTQSPQLTLPQVAQETGLHKSTILRLANSIILYGFLHRDAEGLYSVRASVWRLGLIFRQEFVSREQVAPALKQLVRATGETASFYMRAG